jgi:phospholipid transport system substrate-binding protein
VQPLDEPAGESPVRVRTIMKLSDGSTYHVVYYMRPTPQGWKIVDVLAEGVSYVRTYRTDFGAEVRERGLDALIERLLATT